MNDRVKCSRCGLELELELVLAELCLGCLGVLAADTAVLQSVNADLRSRGVPADVRAGILRALLEQATAPRLAPRVPAIATQVLAGQLKARPTAERLEGAAVIGAGAWESWVAESETNRTPAGEGARIARFLALRPYRREVVRLILDALTECGAIVWS